MGKQSSFKDSANGTILKIGSLVCCFRGIDAKVAKSKYLLI